MSMGDFQGNWAKSELLESRSLNGENALDLSYSIVPSLANA